jgi:transposase, IS5 family
MAHRTAALERLSSLIDRQLVAARLAPPYPSAKGEPAWPPLSLLKALLLAVWRHLSDVKLAAALKDRPSFRRVRGFAVREATPERTALVRFRRARTAQGPDRKLFEAVTIHFTARAITARTGTLVEATVITSASTGDGEACWVKHRNRGAVHGIRGACRRRWRHRAGRAGVGHAGEAT